MNTIESLPKERVQRWTLVAMILASGTVFLQGSVLNVALPAIERSLETGLAGLQWTVNGYLLTLSTLLILGGALGDRYGRRRMMFIGLVSFGVAALICGLAPAQGWLIAARILQGAAGALLVPGALAILRATYTDPQARGEAIGHWSGWSGITTVIGPLVGGWMVDTLSWRWAFFVTLPLIAVTAWLMIRYVPESRAEEERPLDPLGAVVAMVGLSGVVYALIQGPNVGWTRPGVWLSGLTGVIGLLLFPWIEARVPDPMLPLSLFRRRNFTGANLTTLGVYFALQGTNFFLVLYLQNVLGYSAFIAGLILAPTSLILLALSSRMGRWAEAYGARRFMTFGPLLVAVGVFLLSLIHPDVSLWAGVLPGVVVFGLGLAGTVAPLTDTVMSAAPEEHSGVAAAFNNVVSRIAGLLAVAGLGVVVSLSFDAALNARLAPLTMTPETQAQITKISENPTGAVDTDALPADVTQAVQAAYTGAFRRVMWVNAGLAAAGGLLAAITIRRKQDTSPDEP
jgi:EmrB/QacA subfamily drug resistance transporter